MSPTNMHRKDFKPCVICHKGVMHTGLPLFWRVHIERIGVDMQAAQRQHELEQFFGSTSPDALALALADVFSDGAPIGKPMDEGKTVLICETCAMADMPIAEIAERSS